LSFIKTKIIFDNNENELKNNIENINIDKYEIKAVGRELPCLVLFNNVEVKSVSLLHNQFNILQ